MNTIPDMRHISTLTRERIMRTVSIFKNGNNRAIRLPRDMDFEGVSELEIVREGDRIILRPVRPTWARSRRWKKQTRTLWRSVRTLSVTKDGLTCEQNVYAGH
jgi:antitoxin VapB